MSRRGSRQPAILTPEEEKNAKAARDRIWEAIEAGLREADLRAGTEDGGIYTTSWGEAVTVPRRTP